MKKLVVFACAISLLVGGMQVSGACPRADINGDCKVNMEDFAIMASEWLDIGVPLPVLNGMTWVSIDDPGVDYTGDGVADYEPFIGEMGKYETTNAQYCEYLNSAFSSGDIIVGADDVVYGADGSNSGTDFVSHVYFDTYRANSDSQISYDGGVFSVRSRDGYPMSNHPVVVVSWYGATAFCNYYGYRLPTEWEWQAVADYDGSYSYGCGTTIDQSKANYKDSDYANPLGLISFPYTSPVDHYPSFGYGMNDMAGNLSEWTDSIFGSYYRAARGGSYISRGNNCTVSRTRSSGNPNSTYNFIGFRVCR